MTSTALAGCDSAQAKAAPGPAAAPAHPRLVLATTILASSLAFVDGSVVNVGLPAIGRGLHGDAQQLQWIINAYLLPLSALLLTGGALGDRFGRQRLLVIGTALFGLASVACGLAPSLPWLLGFRALQGMGAALLMPNSLAILGAAFSGAARGGAIGVWAAAGAITGALGPVLGGLLIDGVGWRSIFFLNAPLAVGAIALALRYVANDADPSASRPLDLAGAALATAALGGLTWGLTEGSGPGGWSAGAVAGLIAGLAALAAFLWRERRLGEAAMMPLALFASRGFVGLSLLTLLVYGALGGLLVLLPYVLIQAAGYSATGAGAALLPFAVILTVLSPMMGALAGRLGSRWLLSLGALVTAGGFVLLLRVGAGGGYWTTVLPAMAVISLGMAAVAAPLTTAVLGSVDGAHTGVASGLNSALARTGGMIATALLGAVLAGRGARLIGDFHAAALFGAAGCVAGGVCAMLLLSSATVASAPESR